jgi:hypothetical protein
MFPTTSYNPVLGGCRMSAEKTVKQRKFPKQGTIGHIVLTTLAHNSEPDFEELKKKVLAKFPDSKFNPAHLSWYKHQVRIKAYPLLDAGDEGDSKGKNKKSGKAKTSPKASSKKSKA